MKKVYITISVFLILFLVIILSKNIVINKNNNSNPDNVLKDLMDNKSGIYVFGFEECPWCKQLYPVLDTVLNDSNQKARYVDIRNQNFTQSDRNNLKKYIIKNTTFEEVVVPLVIMISDDNSYQYHVGTLEGHDAPNAQLTLAQKEELKEKLKTMTFEYENNNQK